MGAAMETHDKRVITCESSYPESAKLCDFGDNDYTQGTYDDDIPRYVAKMKELADGSKVVNLDIYLRTSETDEAEKFVEALAKREGDEAVNSGLGWITWASADGLKGETFAWSEYNGIYTKPQSVSWQCDTSAVEIKPDFIASEAAWKTCASG
jgi:hypothetical protein